MKKLQKTSRLQLSLLRLSILPAVIIGVLSIFIGLQTVKQSMVDDVEATLRGVCGQTEDTLLELFPEGGYRIEGGHYYAGDSDLYESIKYIDKIKDNFGAEVTVFLGNTRAITTITDSDGNRLIGTVQDDEEIIKAVYDGNSYMSDNVIIHGEKYYGTYMPLYDNGEVVGMLFAGITKANFGSILSNYFGEIIVLIGILLIFVVCYVTIYSKDMADELGKIKSYLGSLALRQTSDVEMDASVLERNDEIGDLGRYAVEAGNQLKCIIGRDPLTNLLNRRAGIQSLEKLLADAKAYDSKFTVVMCDIDFFKNINDKYGHDIGDVVLRETSEFFVKFCDSNGVAIRWGGEEFVLGLKLNLEETLSLIEKIRKEIKKKKFAAGSNKFGITITFGVETYDEHPDVKSLVVSADEKLYRGKQGGRDCVVYEEAVKEDNQK